MTRSYETDRLILRVLDKDAAPMVLSFFEDNREQFEPWEPARGHNFYTLSYQEASLAAEYNLIAEEKLVRFWVSLKGGPTEVIGTVCLQNLLKEPYHSCVLGYKISRRHQQHGYAAESIAKCIEVAFEEYHMHRINAYIMPDNTASLRVIERLAFHKEGVSRSYARINGVWRDHIHYARINPSDQPVESPKQSPRQSSKQDPRQNFGLKS